MWSVATLINVSKYALAAASLNQDRGALFGATTDPALPSKILVFSEVVQWAYAQYGDTADVKKMSNFLYTLCDPSLDGFGGGDSLFTTSGSAVSIGSGSSTTVFPIHITQASFESDGITYNDSRIVGKNLGLQMNDLNQRIISAGSGFSYTSTGIVMNTGDGAAIPDFDATLNNYDIYIFQVST